MKKLLISLLFAGAAFAQNPTVATNTATLAPGVSQNTPGDAKSNNAGVPTTVGGTGLPLEVFPFLFNGSTWDRPFTCPSSAVVSVTAAATGQIVALVSGQIVRVCSVVLSSTAAATATLSYGTGSNCGTGNTALSGAIALGASAPVQIHLGSDAALRTASGNAFCIAATGATVTGFVSYAQF